MEHTSHLHRKPEHEDQNSSKENTSYSSVESLLEHSGQSGSIKPRSVAMSSSDLTVQKKSSAGSAMSNVGKAGGAAVGRAGKITGSSGSVKTQPTYVKSKTVIVEDDQKPSGVQMTKSKFLAALDKSVRATADPLLAKKGTSTDNCPWLYWAFTYYEYMSGAAEIQTALNTYITSTQGASSATDLISKVSAYVKTHVAYWVKTGKVTGVPKDLMGQLPAVKQAASSKTIQKKGTGAMDAGDSGSAQNVHHQLEGGGQSLSGSVRSQMESALGTDLSGVKIHTGGEAGSIASEQNAKALTVGQHIAFGSGEYQPGTMHGDALLAHELAHTIQQRGATESVQSKEENPVSYNALEHDADNAAVSAVSGIWGSTKEWASKLGKKTGAALRSGLQLQKCGPDTPANQQGQTLDNDPKVPQAQTQTDQTNETFSGTATEYIEQQMLNKPMVWVSSGRESTDSRFANWARGTQEQGSYTYMAMTPNGMQPVSVTGPPSVSVGSAMNCFEMIMLSMYYSKTLVWEDIHALYTSKSEMGAWEQEVVALLTKGKTAKQYKFETTDQGVPVGAEDYDPAMKNIIPAADQKSPAKGAVVFFNDGVSPLSHVAVATGEQSPTPNPISTTDYQQWGSITYSFWPRPYQSAKEYMTIQIEKPSIEELIKTMRLKRTTTFDNKKTFSVNPMTVTYYE